MRISASSPYQDRDGRDIPVLYWILLGIGCGEITGNEPELRELILSHLTDQRDIEFIRFGSDTSMFAKLLSYSEHMRAYDDAEICIVYALRVLFEKIPLALITRVPVEGEEEGMSKCVLRKIGESDRFQKLLYPELSAFFINNIRKLNESQLLLMAHAFHENAILIQLLLDTVSATNPDEREALARHAMKDDILERNIQLHWQPEHRGDVAYFYTDFPEIEMWRLFMDGERQDIGWATYDSTEPGCINQLYQAWLFLKTTYDRPLTPDFFKQIHAISSKNILPEQWSTRYREEPPAYCMNSDTTTFLGYLYQHQQLGRFCGLMKHPDDAKFRGFSKISTAELDDNIIEIIKEYELNAGTHKDDPRSLLIDIILLCKKLVLIHPFRDCNGRLFCNLLINRELVRHGFSPTLLDNPNRFDGWSPGELLSEVMRGMIVFQKLKHDPIFKNGSTYEFIKTQIYPIPSIVSTVSTSTDDAIKMITSSGHGFFPLKEPANLEAPPATTSLSSNTF